MSVTKALFLVLSMSLSLAFTVHRQRKGPVLWRPILKLRDEVEEVKTGGHVNSALRRGTAPTHSTYLDKPTKQEHYHVKVLDDRDNILEIDDTLQKILSQQSYDRSNKKLGFQTLELEMKKKKQPKSLDIVSPDKLVDLIYKSLYKKQPVSLISYKEPGALSKQTPLTVLSNSLIEKYHSVDEQEPYGVSSPDLLTNKYLYQSHFDKNENRNPANRHPTISKLGYKIVDLDEFDKDRQNSAKRQKSKSKIKLIRSLEPPKTHFNKDQQQNRDSTNQFGSLGQSVNLYDYGKNKKSNKKTIFDKDGMLYLTKPKYAEGRALSSLIQKVLKYKEQEDLGYRLKPRQKFSKNELEQIKLIAKAIVEEDAPEEIKESELDQLLRREQQLQEENDALKITESNLENSQDLEKMSISTGYPYPLQNKPYEAKSPQGLRLIMKKPDEYNAYKGSQGLRLLDEDEIRDGEKDRDTADVVQLLAQSVQQRLKDELKERKEREVNVLQIQEEDYDEKDLQGEDLRQLLNYDFRYIRDEIRPWQKQM